MNDLLGDPVKTDHTIEPITPYLPPPVAKGKITIWVPVVKQQIEYLYLEVNPKTVLKLRYETPSRAIPDNWQFGDPSKSDLFQKFSCLPEDVREDYNQFQMKLDTDLILDDYKLVNFYVNPSTGSKWVEPIYITEIKSVRFEESSTWLCKRSLGAKPTKLAKIQDKNLKCFCKVLVDLIHTNLI